VGKGHDSRNDMNKVAHTPKHSGNTIGTFGYFCSPDWANALTGQKSLIQGWPTSLMEETGARVRSGTRPTHYVVTGY
jgi:hypothetical protein